MEGREGYTVRCSAPECEWMRVLPSREELVVWELRWDLYHDHGGHFTVEARFPVGRDQASYRIGEEFVFKTRESRGDDGNNVIATAPDGKVALFDREVALTEVLEPGKLVRGVVRDIRPNVVIVTPLEILGNIPPLDHRFPYRPDEGA